MNKKGYILVNLGQIKDENPPKQYVNLKFWNVKMSIKFQKGHCVRLPHVISA